MDSLFIGSKTYQQIQISCSHKVWDNVVELLSDITPTESQDVVDPSQPTFQSKFEKVSAKTSKSDMSKGKPCRLSRYSDPLQGWAHVESDSEEELVHPQSKSVKDTVLIEVSNMRSQLLSIKDELSKSVREGTYDCAT